MYVVEFDIEDSPSDFGLTNDGTRTGVNACKLSLIGS